MNVFFRKATANDIDDMIKLCNECFEENTDIIQARKIFEETKNDTNQIYLVGEINDEIVSTVKITIIPTIYTNMGTYAILNHVCVKKEYRRCNICTNMLKECENICKEYNCSDIKLWSMNFRIAAHECYKNFGFKKQEAGFFSKNIKE